MASMKRHTSRLREKYISLPMVFIGPVAVSLSSFLILVAVGLELGINLAFIGLLFGLLLPIGLEIRSRASRIRRLAVIDYRNHHFGHAVWRGVERSIKEDSRSWQVELFRPSAEDGNPAQWQAQQLRTITLKDFDAVVLIPALDDRDVWFALAAAVKAGVFAVVVDTKPPSYVFRESGIDEPRFVSSRYAESGVVTYDILDQFLIHNNLSSTVLWIGPKESWPGSERSRNIVYGLAMGGQLDRTHLIEMDDWRPSDDRCRETLDFATKAPGRVAVYCGDDENAWKLHFLCLTERPSLRRKLYIVGCNATPDDLGQVGVIDLGAVEATVDIRAEQQGRECGLLLVKERTGKLNFSERSHYVMPTATFRGEANPWLDLDDPSAISTVVESSAQVTEHNDPDELDDVPLRVIVDHHAMADHSSESRQIPTSPTQPAQQNSGSNGS